MNNVNDDQLVGAIVFKSKIFLYIICVLIALVVGLSVGLGGTIWYAKNKIESIKREYFATTHNGSLFQLTPLDSPIGGEEKALNFSSTCVIRMFQLDYVNYRRQQAEAQRTCFTDPGYISYLAAFERAGLMELLRDPKTRLVLAATPGPGEFVDKSVKVTDGVARQSYTITHPIDIVFNGNVNQPRRGSIEVDLLRIDQANRADGLAVHAIRVKVNKT